MMAAASRWAAMAWHEARVLLASPGVVLAAVVLAAVPLMTAWFGPSDAEYRGPLVRGMTTAALAFGLPSMAALLGSGILRSRLSTQELTKSVSRAAFATSRLAGVVLVLAVIGVLVAAAGYAVDPLTGVREYQRPEAASVEAHGARQGRDGRWWLIGGGERLPSLQFKVPVTDLQAGDTSQMAIDLRVVRGVPRPGSQAAQIGAPSTVGMDEAQAALALGAPVVASYWHGDVANGKWVTPNDQRFRDSKLSLLVPSKDIQSDAVMLRIVRGSGEFVPGVHLAEVRLAAGEHSLAASMGWLLVAVLAASACVAATGLAFGAPFARATALLACLCVLIAGWLAPELRLGEKPRLLRAMEAPVLESGMEAAPVVKEDSLASWYPRLGLPASRERIQAGEVLPAADALDEVKWTGVIALVLIAVAWLVMRWRDWEEATADA